MTISIATVFIPVDDPDAAVHFYRDLLGLSVRKDFENAGFRWVTLSTDTEPNIEILLSPVHAGRSQETGAAMGALLANGELAALHFRSDDLDAMFATLTAAPGVEVVQEPTDQPWGTRDAAVRDPAGNVVRILQA